MRSLLAAAVTATAGLLVCACSGPASTAAPRATAPSTVSPAAAVSHHPPSPGGSAPDSPAASASAGSPVTSQPAGTSSPGAVPGCLSRYLSATIVPSGDALDSVYVNIDFTNLGRLPCTLYGYPGVSLAGGQPVTPIGLPSTENPATPRVLVTLWPGGVAYTQLQIVQAATYPAARCQPRATGYLAIIPPNQTIPIPVSYTAAACARPIHLLTVGAVQLGINH
jgi:hypothetical protein